MRMRYFYLVFLLIIFTSSSGISANPLIDGNINNDEWSNGTQYYVPMTNGVLVNLTVMVSDIDIYMLIVMPHNSPGDKIQLLADNYTYHDYFGIEFDNNKDDAIMGTFNSPDDTIMIDYIEEGGIDMYMHSFEAFTDEGNGGTDDITGRSGSADGNLIFEIRRPLITNDESGYDISLKEGDKFLVMLAFWDDALPHSATTYVNERVGNNQFIELQVGSAINDPTREYIALGTLALAGLITFVVFYFDISKESIKKVIQRFNKN
jgi:hypothetical protein